MVTLLRKGRIHTYICQQNMSMRDNSSVTFHFHFFSFVLGSNFQVSALSAECQPFYNLLQHVNPLELPYVSCLPCQLKACALSCSPLPYLCCSWWQPGDYFSWQFSHRQECPRCICCGCAESGKVGQSQRQAAGGMRMGGGCAWQAGSEQEVLQA